MLLSPRRVLVALSLPVVATVLTVPVAAGTAAAAPTAKKSTVTTTKTTTSTSTKRTTTDAGLLKNPRATKPHGRRWN